MKVFLLTFLLSFPLFHSQEEKKYPAILCTVVGIEDKVILLNCREPAGEFGLKISESNWPSRFGVNIHKGTKVVMTEKNGELTPWYRISPDCAPNDTCCIETRRPVNRVVGEP